MLRMFTDRMFNVSNCVEQFKRDNPTIPVLAAGATKVIKLAETQDNQIVRGEHWVHSVRGTLIATPEALVCLVLPSFAPIHDDSSGIDQYRDFTIATNAITYATVAHVREGPIRGVTLKIMVNDGRRFQFGLMPDAAWEHELPFPVHVTSEAVGWTRYSIMARVRLALYLLVVFAAIALFLYR